MVMGAEGVVFAVDVDAEVGQEVVKGSTRLDIIRQCISFFINSKKKVNPKHRFAIAAVTDKPTLLTPALTSSVEELEAAAQKLQPQAGPCPEFELGTLTSLGRMLGEQTAKVRVVLIYCRSKSLTTWAMQGLGGVAVDVVYIHEKPCAGVNCPQEVYNALEEQADAFARSVGHSAYIFEASAQNHRKIFQLMVWLMAHPSTRPQQQHLPAAPLDLAASPQLPTNLPAPSSVSASALASPSSSGGHGASVGLGTSVGTSPHSSMGTPASVISSPVPPYGVTQGPAVTVSPAALGVPTHPGAHAAGVGGVGPVPYPSYPVAAPGAHTVHTSVAPVSGVGGPAAPPPGVAMLGPFPSAAEAAAAAAQLPQGH